MDFESNSLTPPGSPLIGYSGFRHKDNLAGTGLVYCFSCKGQLRSHDNSFSQDGYILRREVISAVEILSPDNKSLDHNVEAEKLCLHNFFGKNFDMTDKMQLDKLICLSRKNIATLDTLSEPSFSYGITRFSLDADEEPAPWKLRRDVSLLMNYFVSRLNYYKNNYFTGNDIEDLFGGLRQSLSKSECWSNSLKNHCGSREGNECTSAIYHFFHLHLDIRWSFFIIYGMNTLIIDWIFNDLIYLAWFKYTVESEQNLLMKHPFNCYCLKELWTMLRLVLDEVKPKERDFWDIFTSAMSQFSSKTEHDVFFPLWLTVHLASLSDYTLCGVYDRAAAGNSIQDINPICYGFINEILTKWCDKGGKTAEVIKIITKLVPYWGFDNSVISVFFNHWLPRIDKNVGISNLDSFSSIERWMKLILTICSPTDSNDGDEADEYVKLFASDPFLSFIRLIICHTKLSDLRNWRKLKSNICLKLDNRRVNKYGEIGILRTTTLYLSLAFASSDSLSLCGRMMDALKDANSSHSRQKTIIRASATMQLILLQKCENITQISADFLRIIDEVLAQTVTDSVKKDLVMIYLDLLQCLPDKTPDFSEENLGRALLISPNLTLWLNSCGPDYVTRTLRVLSKLTAWVVSSHSVLSEEKDLLAAEIFTRTSQFLMQSAMLNQNRIPSTDVEPMANLGADLTILARERNALGEGFERLFDSFAMCERTCPEISQHYVCKLLDNEDFAQNSYSDVKWIQVWIRLVALGCTVPDKLNSKILNDSCRQNDNETLLQLFCEKTDHFSRNDIQTILTPLILLLKGVMNSVFKDNIVVTSIVKSCAVIVKHIKFDKIYVRNDTRSVIHEMLQMLFPPVQSPHPWDRLPAPAVACLGNYMFDIFLVMLSYTQFSQDPYLQRKVRDVVNFALLGYLKQSDQIDSLHAGLRIMQYSVDTKCAFVLEDIIPNFYKLISTDPKLIQRFLWVVNGFRHHRMTEIVVRCLPTVISIYVSQMTDPSFCCSNVVIFCCGYGVPTWKSMVLQAFEVSMNTTFGNKHKRYYELLRTLTTRNQNIVRFVKDDLLPLVDTQVELWEMKRGVGKDNTLRQPLMKLKNDVNALL